MTVPRQRQRILSLFQEHADSEGHVPLTNDDIFRLTGINYHDLTKVSWGLQKERLLTFRQRKIGQGTRGRTRNILFDFRLTPKALNAAEDKRAEFKKIVDSVSAELTTIDGKPTAVFIPAQQKEEAVLSEHPADTSFKQTLSPRELRSASWPSAKKVRIMDGRQQRIVAIDPSLKRNNPPGVITGFTKQGDYRTGTYLGDIIEENGNVYVPHNLPRAERAEKVTVTQPEPKEETASVLPASEYPSIVQILERETQMLIAVEALEKAGRKDLATAILNDVQNTEPTPLEKEIVRLLSVTGIRIS